MSKLRTTLILSDEYSVLSDRLKHMAREKAEIAQLWKDANLQWSETFWHDNPILEAKHEKSRLLSMQREKFSEIEKRLSACLIITEDEISKRKSQELLEKGKISIDVGSIIRLKIGDSVQESELLVAGLTQGTKISFMWKKYSTICATSPIRWGIAWKYAGEEGAFLHDWKKKSVLIVDVR